MKRIGVLLLAFGSLHAEPLPWFTGPLLTPSGRVITRGHVNFEPYFYARDFKGEYDPKWHSIPALVDTWEFRSRNILKIGLSEDVNLRIIFQASYKMKGDVASIQFGDLPIGLDIALVKSKPNLWYPNLKFSVTERFPTGKYQKGDPLKEKTDLNGRGCFATQFALTASQLYHIKGKHYIDSRFSVNYYWYYSTHVKGFNTYGGGHGTDGTVHPGGQLSVLTGHEISLSQRWAIACDFIYRHFNSTHFSGRKGTTTLHGPHPAQVKHPSSEQFSIAPALEYNFSKQVGLIGGVWFTVAGRNSTDFISGVIALNCYH